MWFIVAVVVSRIQLFATPRTVARQAPLSMGFSREEYWSGLPCPPPGDLPNPGIKPRSPVLQADSLSSEPLGKSTMWINLENIVLIEKKKVTIHRLYNSISIKGLELENL